MDKLDRIQKLFQLFMTHRHPISLRTQADKLDCTQKSARRLIDVLQDFTLAPIGGRSFLSVSRRQFYAQ